MGQQQIIPYKQYQKQYAMVSKNQSQELLIRHKQNQKQFMLRKVIVNSEQELEERLKILNRRRKIKSDHILNIVDFKPIKDDKICGSTTYVSLLIEYPFESLYYETLHRLSYPKESHKNSISRVAPLHFQQHQLWSILYSSALGLEALYSNDMPHEGITKSMVLIDKDGGVKIGDPILLGSRTNYEKVIQMIENDKKLNESGIHQGARTNFYFDKNNGDLKKLSRGKSTGRKDKKAQESTSHQKQTHKDCQIADSVIISPELISFCKDHQSYYYDKEKSDVYVLGAMMVELALLENVFSFNIKENKLKKDGINLFSDNSKLKQKYSAAFLDILQEMINIDPKKRPNLSQIVQKIQEFSIQQNSQSDHYSLKKHNTECEPLNQNQSQNLLNKYIFSDQPFNNYVTKISDLGYGNTMQFKTGNVDPSNHFSNFNFSNQFNLKPNEPFKMQTIPYQFPSFSTHKDNLTNNLGPKPVYEQSAVKSLFSNRLPFQIKYVQSPLIMPVSNVRGKRDFKDTINGNEQTPFHNLNLTESNQKWVRKQTDKQSIVKQKITLFGQNITADQLMAKINEKQPISNTNNERFSMNNFGKIQLSNNLSIQNSVSTSMIPTPRFENPFSTQSVPKLSEINKSMFPYHPPLSTFDTHMNSPYGATESYSKNATLQAQFNVTNSLTSSLNNYPKLDSNQGPMLSSYDPKKQGFSISQDVKQSSIGASGNKDAEPYYSNSSVGYTLPKYRPESTSSEVIKSASQQKSRCSSADNPVSQINHPKTSRTENVFKQTESFLQRVDSSPHEIQAFNQKTNKNDTTPVLSQLMSEKQETYSIGSSQNTVRKNNQNSFKNSAKKKYNFYKKELNQKLQKITTPSPAQSEQILLSTSIRQNCESSTKKQQRGMNRQQSKIQIQYEPQNHSVYVQQKQSNGSIYRGFKLNDQRHGHGTLMFADSGFYEGQFYQNKMQGEGKLYYNQHDLAYQGQFLHNCFHGHGILYNNNPQKINGRFDFANLRNINNYWLKYEGYFKDDQKSGKCHLYLTNGEEFEGFCQNNTFQGNGEFKTIDGDEIEGVWRNNVLIEIKNETKAFDVQN